MDPSRKWSSLGLTSSRNIRLKSSSWFPRASFLGLRAFRLRRGGMVVASSIELNDVGMWRSLDELEVDRRDNSEPFEGVRDRLSLCIDIFREPRLGGITTGVVFSPRASDCGVGRGTA